MEILKQHIRETDILKTLAIIKRKEKKNPSTKTC